MIKIAHFKRLWIVVGVYLLIQTGIRAALYLRELAVMDFSPVLFGKIMGIGWCYDVITASFALAPLALYYSFMPASVFYHRHHRAFQQAAYFILLYALFFDSVSEWLFWDEFRTRFNFIAVDYLVYTDEVVGNIRESYPLGILLPAIFIAALTIFLLTRKAIFATHAPHLSFRQRLAFGALMLMLPLGAYASANSAMSPVSDNSFANDIAKNGIYELFNAFFNNALDYDSFYLTQNERESRANLDMLMREPGAGHFKPGTIERHISASGPERKYNVVLITVESLSAEYLGAFGNKEGLTPYLDALADQSLLFTNLYAIGTRTVYGLSAITLGLPPVPGNAIARQEGNDRLFSLGSEFGKRGYDVKFIYGGYGYFDNMNAFFSGNGYGIVDRAKLESGEITFANVWGVCDEDLFNRALKESDASYKAGKPFFQMIMTTSNHRPFTYPDGKIDIPSPGGRRGGVKYTDYAIHTLIENAKKKPWFKDTIFVIIADHTAGSAGKTELQPSKYHIPLLVYAPGIVKPRKIDNLVSQIDLPPTLLGLLNFSYDSKFLGKDLLKSNPGRAFLATYQLLGYAKEHSLTILKPIRAVSYYRRDGDALTKAEPDPEWLRDSVSYYQTAAHWKDASKLPATQDKSTLR